MREAHARAIAEHGELALITVEGPQTSLQERINLRPPMLQNNDLKRALQCLLTMSNSRDIGQDGTGLGLNDILNLTAKKENIVEAVQGIVKFAKEFLELIDAADATEQADIAREALKRLAAAGSVKGALQGHELRGLALRLANHGELTRLGVYF